MICRASYLNVMGRLIERVFTVYDVDDYINYTDNFIHSSVSKFMFTLYSDNGELREILFRGFSV